MTFLETEMKELGKSTSNNTHKTSMSQTFLQTEGAFTVKEYEHTHTHTHTQTHTHTHTPHTHTHGQ